MRFSCWRLIALLSLSTLASAASALDCDQAQTQADMTECAGQALIQADAELNRTYLDYRNGLDRNGRNQIRDVQLAWIKYRDLTCRYTSAASTGGSVHSLALQLCLTAKTRERTSELKALSTCPEGDVACVH